MLAIVYPVKKVEKIPTFWMCKINYDIGALQHDMLPKQNRLIKAKNIRQSLARKLDRKPKHLLISGHSYKAYTIVI